MPEESSRGSNINYWLELFGYDLSSEEEDLDIEAELDKIMREMHSPSKNLKGQEEDDSILEEGLEYEESGVWDDDIPM